jgi:hypothetical protein
LDDFRIGVEIGRLQARLDALERGQGSAGRPERLLPEDDFAIPRPAGASDSPAASWIGADSSTRSTASSHQAASDELFAANAEAALKGYGYESSWDTIQASASGDAVSLRYEGYLQRFRDHCEWALPRTTVGDNNEPVDFASVWRTIEASARADAARTGNASHRYYLQKVHDHAAWLLPRSHGVGILKSVERAATNDATDRRYYVQRVREHTEYLWRGKGLLAKIQAATLAGKPIEPYNFAADSEALSILFGRTPLSSSPGMWIIRKNCTGSGQTEAHLYTMESGYRTAVKSLVLPLHETDESFSFLLADWNGDGVPDLWAIKRWGTNSGQTELFILDGASDFSRYLVMTPTWLGPAGDEFTFDTVPHPSRANPDLVCYKHDKTSSGFTEMHVLSGENPLAEPSHRVTKLPALGSRRAIFMKNLGFATDRHISFLAGAETAPDITLLASDTDTLNKMVAREVEKYIPSRETQIAVATCGGAVTAALGGGTLQRLAGLIFGALACALSIEDRSKALNQGHSAAGSGTSSGEGRGGDPNTPATSRRGEVTVNFPLMGPIKP